MKIRVMCVMFFLCVSGLAQDKPAVPTVPLEQKLFVREAQHKLDAVEKQLKDLGLQFQQMQSQMQTKFSQLSDQQKAAQAEVEKTSAGLCGDAAKWRLDSETLTCSAIPAPAAPANASTPNPTPPGSSGAAVSPKKTEQAKK